MQEKRDTWIVLKFGGTSVAKAGNWNTIADLVKRHSNEGRRLLIVHSALAGVTNTLERVAATVDEAERKTLLDHLHSLHRALAADLGLDGDSVFAEQFDELRRFADQVSKTTYEDPRLRAQIVSQGELLATRIGHATLCSRQLDVGWLDARRELLSTPGDTRSETQNYISATCDVGPDADFRDRLADMATTVLTQGFIARDPDGDTVLLGREGSDTSAAYFSVMLGAEKLEIWTDVPGMFTADPRLVPSARILSEVSYEEAQELASTGSKVLHPRSIAPIRSHGIPMYIRCTSMPQLPGTRIAARIDEHEPQVKGLSTRAGITLISMQSAAMWHEVGFLADAFDCFRRHGISIDLVSTSETNVTVTIDSAEDLAPASVMSSLVGELEQLCRVRIVENCAVVSLVGQRIRAILPRLAPALAVFEEERIHLVSQAANDLNLSFVIDADQARRLLVKLHTSIIRAEGGGALFGPSWEALMQGQEAKVLPPLPWWQLRRDRLLQLSEEEPCAYVYDIATVRRAAQGLQGLSSIDRVLYAVKANTNATILRELATLGVDFECVSPGEVRLLQNLLPELPLQRILFTPNFAPKSEYEWALATGLQLTLDNLYPLQHWPEVFSGRELLIRIDPGKGRGHHDHVRTGGNQSKFGVPLFEIDELQRLADAAGVNIVGLHAHAGSGILDPENWRSVAERLAAAADRFPNVRALDLGGGIGVPEKAGDDVFDLQAFDELLGDFKSAHPRFELWVEPGRFLVAEAGVLLSRVTQLKGKGNWQYVGIGTGMNSLIRPALYGAYHEIVNLTRSGQQADRSVTVVGPICESGDKLGSDRLFPETFENDVILIANTGAYGQVMSSRYNLRDAAAEIAI